MDGHCCETGQTCWRNLIGSFAIWENGDDDGSNGKQRQGHVNTIARFLEVGHRRV